MRKDYLFLQERHKTSLLTSKLLFNRNKKKVQDRERKKKEKKKKIRRRRKKSLNRQWLELSPIMKDIKPHSQKV